MIGYALVSRRRVYFMAKSELFRVPGGRLGDPRTWARFPSSAAGRIGARSGPLARCSTAAMRC